MHISAAQISDALMKRGRRIHALMRLRSFETSTAEGRSDERLRRVFWTAATAVLAKGLNTVTLLIAVPITLSYLGAERYGFWMTVTSAVAFLGIADLGIGNGVLNIVSDSHGRNDAGKVIRCVSSAFFLLSGIALGLAILFAVLSRQVHWANLFNVSSTAARSEAGPAVAVFVGCVLANLPLSIVPRIQMGYQEGYYNSIWQGASNVLALAGIVAIVRLRAGLPWLVLAIAGAPIVENALNGISLFAFRRPHLLPRPRHVEPLLARKILSLGFFFLLIQAANVTVYYVDNIIIARVLGPEAVTRYAVPMRLFSILPAILWMVLSPLWPAYGEAAARGDDSWLKSTLFRAVSITLSFCLAWSLLLVVFGGAILRVWTGGRVPFSRSLMVAMGLSMTVTTIITAIALFLNAMNKIRFQVVFGLSAALLSTIAKVLFVRSFGLVGIVWGNIGVMVLIMLVPYGSWVSKWASLRIREASCGPT